MLAKGELELLWTDEEEESDRGVEEPRGEAVRGLDVVGAFEDLRVTVVATAGGAGGWEGREDRRSF